MLRTHVLALCAGWVGGLVSRHANLLEQTKSSVVVVTNNRGVFMVGWVGCLSPALAGLCLALLERGHGCLGDSRNKGGAPCSMFIRTQNGSQMNMISGGAHFCVIIMNRPARPLVWLGAEAGEIITTYTNASPRGRRMLNY
jgi:hypothetical protein